MIVGQDSRMAMRVAAVARHVEVLKPVSGGLPHPGRWAVSEGGCEEGCDICAHKVDFYQSLAVFTSPGEDKRSRTEIPHV